MSVGEYLGRASYFAVNGGLRTVKHGCGIHPTFTFKPAYTGCPPACPQRKARRREQQKQTVLCCVTLIQWYLEVNSLTP